MTQTCGTSCGLDATLAVFPLVERVTVQKRNGGNSLSTNERENGRSSIDLIAPRPTLDSVVHLRQDVTMEPSDAPPITLLLVDDTPANLLALEAILEGNPEYRLIAVTSGAEALQTVLKETVSVILLDVVMPGMDGFDVANDLKAIERTRNIPILFLTAIATDASYVYRAYDVGAVDYLVKPLDSEIVRKKVAVFVDLVRQRETIVQQSKALREAERREYELRLAELRMASDRRYRKLVEGIDHAIAWTANEAFTLTFISRQATRILGCPAERFLEPDAFINLIHSDDREFVLKLFREAIQEGTDLVCNHRLLAADGRVFWFHTGMSGERETRDMPAELHGFLST